MTRRSTAMNPAAPEPSNSPLPEDARHFLRDVEAALVDQALPLFEEAARHARRGGIEVTVEMDSSDPLQPQLRLAASNPGRAPAVTGSSPMWATGAWCTKSSTPATTRPAPSRPTGLDQRNGDRHPPRRLLPQGLRPAPDYVTERRQAGSGRGFGRWTDEALAALCAAWRLKSPLQATRPRRDRCVGWRSLSPPPAVPVLRTPMSPVSR